ncbi:MAG: hypothetical protein Q9180_001284 [Flavoplaca navasiana]
MSRMRRVCYFTVKHPSDYIWISDDILNHAISRYTQLCVGRRHGSAIPGPLEARKRATKRRMMGLAPAIGGTDMDPGFLAGLGRGQENQQGWQWQSPKLPPSKHPPRVPMDDDGWCSVDQLGTNSSRSSDLPAWLTHFDHTDVKSDAEGKRSSEPRANIDPSEAVSHAYHHKKPKTQPCRSPEAWLKDNIHIDSIREVIGSIEEHDPMRKVCSRLAFRQLLDSGCDMDKILEFWVDPLLNPWRANNLPFFVAHCVESSKVEEMTRFCDWTVRQFYVGACPDRNVLVLITELSRLKERHDWQEILLRLCQNVAQALLLSPVLRVEHIAAETYSSLLAILFDDIHTPSRFELGLNMVKNSSLAQLRNLAGLVWPIIERWIYMWEPSTTAEPSSTTLSSSIADLLNKMPYSELLKVVQDVSWRILNLPLSEKDPTTLWRKHSLWWSAIRSPELFQHIRKASFWSEISAAIRKRQEMVMELRTLIEIDECLNQHDLQAAYRTFLCHPQITLESCPNLAETLILDPKRDWRTALMLCESRQATFLAKQRSAGSSYVAEHLQHARVRLLERMALAYAQQKHIPTAMIFYYVHGCWKLQERDNLGPMRPAMIHAITLSAIVRPLQVGRQVSRIRMEWILRMVAEVEGVDASTRLGAITHDWLNKGYQQARLARGRMLRQNLSQRHHEQNIRVQETDPWDDLIATSEAQPHAPSRHGQSVRSVPKRNSITDMYSAASASGMNGANLRPASLSSSKDEEDDDDVKTQPAEETLVSSLVSETATFVESTNASLVPIALEERRCVTTTDGNSSTNLFKNEELQNVPGRKVPETLGDRDVEYGKRGNACLSSGSSPGAIVDSVVDLVRPETQPKQVHPIRTRDQAISKRVRDRNVYALSHRLNAAHIASLDIANPSVSLLEAICLPKVPSIPTCTLALGSANPAQLGKVLTWRKRIFSPQYDDSPLLRHGMREYPGPTTLANAREPALGPGLLCVQWILEWAERGEKRLDLSFSKHGRVETPGGRKEATLGGIGTVHLLDH